MHGEEPRERVGPSRVPDAARDPVLRPLLSFSSFIVGNGSVLAIHHGFLEQVVLAGNTCQIDATAMVVSGILWKCSLVEEGRETILAKNGVDTLLKLVQQFLGSVIVCRNAVGCLALLCTHSEPPRAW